MIIAEYIIQSFVSLLGTDKVLTDPVDRLTYGYDNSREQALPDLVVFPENHDDVVLILKLCHEHKIPVTCRGRGTGTTGAAVPVSGGVVLSTERMTSILEMVPDDRLMVVEPGVTNKAVQQAAEEQGFFWPPDPTISAVCTIGGNLAYNSAGPRADRFGWAERAGSPAYSATSP